MGEWIVISIVLAAWVACAAIFIRRASAVFFQALGDPRETGSSKQKTTWHAGLRQAHE
ncbi:MULTISPECIES: hypothetical protein [Burkholderia]|uniref:Uncharacterized protein n=1 Tax=Burkholderia singularis TaxID=1503053 RepID=A0A238HCH4_9BURK|nr:MULTISPECIES: hypothetical protein [Burkholderia]SMG02587.1 hypothetical protein BSIN_1029 [Burkholderia singularis]